VSPHRELHRDWVAFVNHASVARCAEVNSLAMLTEACRRSPCGNRKCPLGGGEIKRHAFIGDQAVSLFAWGSLRLAEQVEGLIA